MLRIYLAGILFWSDSELVCVFQNRTHERTGARFVHDKCPSHRITKSVKKLNGTQSANTKQG